MTRKDSRKLTAVSTQRKAAEVVVAVNAEIDPKANNAEVVVVEIVLRENAVKVKNAVVVEVATVAAVEEADLELLFLMVKTVQSSNVLNAEAREKDTRANLVRRTILSIAKTALVVADVVTKKEATVRATGVTEHQSQKRLHQLKEVKLLLSLSQKRERESQERRRRRSQ